MAEAVTYGALLLAFALIWGRTLWFLTERSGLVQVLTLRVMAYVGPRPDAVRSMLLSTGYLGLGLIACLTFSFLADLPLAKALTFEIFDIAPTVLGIVAEVSLCNLLVSLYVGAVGVRRAPFHEIAMIPWIEGLRQTPSGLAPLMGAFAAAIEELFFRGVVLLIFLDVTGPFWAVLIAGLLFWVQQVIQVRTFFQALIISAGCISISLVGGLLVLATASVIPAVICHASFVLFFLGQEGANGRPALRKT
ncbi:MAG: CPBP family intramembrane glutamic endopeptidase [Paracoccaceae bacterium]